MGLKAGQRIAAYALGGRVRQYDARLLHKAQQPDPFSYTAAQCGYEAMDRALVAYSAIKTDRPDIENYFMLYEVNEDSMTIALEARYFMPWDAELRPAEAAALHEERLRFDAVCDRIIKRMPDELSAYDKYRYLALVISLVTSYDHEGTGGW